MRRIYAGLTFSAHGPFGPRPSEKVTFWPSCRSSKLAPWTLEEWKNRSLLPLAVLINPKPLSVNFFMVPSGIVRFPDSQSLHGRGLTLPTRHRFIRLRMYPICVALPTPVDDSPAQRREQQAGWVRSLVESSEVHTTVTAGITVWYADTPIVCGVRSTLAEFVPRDARQFTISTARKTHG
jgi:hypothetical protein